MIRLYLVEAFVGHATAVECAARAGQARATAHDFTRAGTAVRFVSWMLVPDDEICFYLFTAGSREDVERVSERAGLDRDRIVEAVSASEAQAGRRRRPPRAPGAASARRAA